MALEVRLDTSGLDKVLRETPGKVEDFLDWKAEAMVAEIVLSFGSSPPGLTYGDHVASQPGYPPNVDTNALRASIRWEPDGPGRRIIMDGVEYGVYLEDGTESIMPRPFMAPVFVEAQRTIEREARMRLGLDR